MQHLLRHHAHGVFAHALLKSGEGRVGKELVAGVAGMHAVSVPDAVERGLLLADPFDDQRRGVAGGDAVGSGDFQALRQASEVRGRAALQARPDLPLEGKHHRRHRRVAVADDAPQEGLVGREHEGIPLPVVVVRAEVEEHQIRLARQHVALEAEDAQQGRGPADGGVIALEARPGIARLQQFLRLCAVGGQRLVRGVGPPRQRGSEEDDIEGFARPGSRIEPGKGTALGFRRQGR